MLTNLEVAKLNKVLVRDNKLVSGVRYANNCVGKGGSNTYNMNKTKGIHIYSLADLDGADITFFNIYEDIDESPFYVAIAAVVEDVVYLLNRHVTKRGGIYCTSYDVIRLFLGDEMSDEKESISYDTDWYYELSPVSDNPDWKTLYVKPEVPDGDEYRRTVETSDLISKRKQEIIKRLSDLEDEICDFERSDDDILDLFAGYRLEYFDAKERSEEIERAISELREHGTVYSWAPKSSISFPHSTVFEREIKENPNRPKEFEEVLSRGLPLYKEMLALKSELRNCDDDE